MFIENNVLGQSQLQTYTAWIKSTFSISSTHHALGHNKWNIYIVGVLCALQITHDWNFHLLQNARRIPVFGGLTPTSCSCNTSNVIWIFAQYIYFNLISFWLLLLFETAQEIIPLLDGKQMGRMIWLIGTRSFSLNKAMSSFITLNPNWREIICETYRCNGASVVQLLCSPNVTFILRRDKNDDLLQCAAVKT